MLYVTIVPGIGPKAREATFYYTRFSNQTQFALNQQWLRSKGAKSIHHRTKGAAAK